MSDVVTVGVPRQVTTRTPQRDALTEQSQRQVATEIEKRDLLSSTVQSLVVKQQPVRTIVTHGQAGPDGEGTGDLYENDNAVPFAVGGIAAGTEFAAPQTMQEMWDALLYPYLAPAFTSFAISGVSSPLEVGASFGPSVTFTWSTSNGSNVSVSSISITDITTSSTIVSGHGNTGSFAATLSGAVSRSSAGSHQFGISGTNTNSGNFSDTLSLQWEWRCYFGNSSNASLAASDVLGLASSRLATGYANTYAIGVSSGYKYICLADAVGGQLNTVKDAETLLNVPMATGANTDGGGFGYNLVSVTNAQGVTANVRVYRTFNFINSALTLVVA